MTIRDMLQRAAERLRDAGISARTAPVDVDVLARHVLGWDRATLLVRRDEPAPADALTTLDALVARRARREPVAYLTGTREFYGRDFAVSPAVLIPRPETELIVDAALARIDADAPVRLADVGTGSGILAVTLAAERPNVRVEATDLSAAALEVAARNARTHGVHDRIAFSCGDMLAPTEGRFGLIVANPPYVAERDASGLSPDVRDFEPAVALFGGNDGLELVQRLLHEASRRLAPDGIFIMEFGAGQQYDVALYVRQAGWELLQVVSDLQGIERVIVCSLRADR